ncbi:large subunit ribosomal protein L7Ae [Vigna unguiculata]|uniref:Large subunit ribosomal protein L7Ae n=1 Tax=Vigna unguiculata TaxID=3917 RepID=A0A4D6MWI9_VIGUN|nr:large subunit ribosomal protein L7Ae [Vigna unguiculata]
MAPKKGVKAAVAAPKKKLGTIKEKVTNPLFEKRPKQFGIGGALPPKRDLTRFVKWPKTVQIQRKKRILKQRLKVPPALNQFTKTLDKNLATNLFKMLLKYRPEDKAEKKERLLKRAQAEADGKSVEAKKPIVVKYGLNHVTYLIEQEKVTNPLFEKRPKQFGIGGALPPKRDLTRFVKWPKTVQIQRKKRILKQRLKVPPALNQFTKTLDKNLATNLFKMLLKYRPEDKAEKKERLLKRAQAEADGKSVEAKKPIVVKYGLNHVTYLIEQNKAQLVVIAHDVDPIELVVWLPALCRKMEIPYCIVKGKARLGTVVHKKTASVLCLTTVKNEDKLEFSRILEAIKANFNDKYDEYRKKWGGGIMGSKSQAKTRAKEKLIAKEAAQRMS